MFSFNFEISKEDIINSEVCDDGDVYHKTESEGCSSKEENIEWISAKQITIEEINFLSIIERCSKLILEERTFDTTCIKYLHHEDVLEMISNDGEITEALSASEDLQSDLIPAVYEGGLKIWECTWDLLDYISTSASIDFNDKRVLDLGCGAGLLGIYSLLNGATVALQDYNEDVIKHLTIPNTICNLAQMDQTTSHNINGNTIDKSYLNKIKMYFGDWEKLPELLLSKGNDFSSEKQNNKCSKFDVIVTCETIYNPINYEKLINIFLSCLNPSGIILVAAKRYYFGVGGGTENFLRKLHETNKLTHRIVFQHEEGVKREIIEIKFK